MLRATRKTARTALRIAMLVAVMVGPVGAFALAHAGSSGGPTGAGLVIFVSLQRAG